MEPIDIHSPQRHRAPSLSKRAIFLTLAIGVPLLLCCGWPAYMVYGLLQGPYDDRVIWYYDDFRVVGGPSAPDSLRAEAVLPRNIAVEGLRSRFVPPNGEVVELDGRRIDLSTITRESAIAASPGEPLRLRDGEDMIQMIDKSGGTCQLTVHFEGQRFKSLSAWSHVRIYNTSNTQSLDLLKDDWSDVLRVFGKPIRKENKRIYIGWGTGS